MPSLETAHARQKYSGATARNYETEREQSQKWQSEQALLTRIIGGLPRGSTALDIPCGTGRLQSIFASHGIKAVGMDVNREMAAQAEEKGMEVRYGDILYIPMGAKSFDSAFCIRLLNWLSPDDTARALRELQRVTREQITFTLRVAEHPRARPLSLVESALMPGWRIGVNEHIDDGKPEDTFRMITLECAEIMAGTTPLGRPMKCDL